MEKANKKVKSSEKKIASLNVAVRAPQTHNMCMEKEKVPVNKTPCNNVERLDYEITPQKMAEIIGDTWKPPMRKPGVPEIEYNEPGGRWFENSKRKVDLLFALEEQLSIEDALPESMHFGALMSVLGLNSTEFTFHD